MITIPVGIQLYSVRDDCARDLPGVLAAIAKMGYAGVEFAGYHNYSATELRKMLADNGLKACGTHIGLEQLRGDALARTVEFNQTIGNPYLVVPWIPAEMRNSRSAWLEAAKLFSEIAEKLAPHGMYTGYHNHHEEFQVVDGEAGFDTFFANSHPRVIMQLDIGNAAHGGADPMAYLKRYPGRSITIHLKEFSATNPNALVGEGDIPWQQVFEICESSGGTEWYIVEQESYAYPPLECIARCRENLKKMGR